MALYHLTLFFLSFLTSLAVLQQPHSAASLLSALFVVLTPARLPTPIGQSHFFGWPNPLCAFQSRGAFPDPRESRKRAVGEEKGTCIHSNALAWFWELVLDKTWTCPDCLQG